MNKDVENKLNKFFTKENKIEICGQKCHLHDFEKLPIEVKNAIPDWYKNLLITYPLNGLLIEINENSVDEISIDYVGFEGIRMEFLDAYPGCAIGNLGFICIGEDPTGGGDPFFISNREGDNPPVYQIYHDVSDVGEEIIKEGKKKIVEQLSDLFAIK